LPFEFLVLGSAALELIGESKAGHTVILFVDEGQRLTSDLLEVVRSLLNFETYEDKLFQIVMAGTLELRDRIMAKRNKALRSRVFAPCMLNPLTQAETAAMIALRCQRAGIANPFDDECSEKLFALSGGVPRTALLICAHAWNMSKRLKYGRVPPELIMAAKEEATVPVSVSEAVA
jgi:general secretion pathway protein A